MEDVLYFWFSELSPGQWWSVDEALDAQIEQRFGKTLCRAAAGEFYSWRSSAAGRLAEIIVLDQFSRNIYRNTPRAFAQDGMALALAQEAVAQGCHLTLDPTRCSFMLMPYMHSESAAVHICAEALFREHAPGDNYQFELRHKHIIDRFGRYPHRNAILGRASTAAELEFLQQPGSSF